MKNIFLNFMLNILKKYMTFIIIYSFFLKKMKSEKIEKIVGWLQVFQLFQFKIFHDKKICYTHKKFEISIRLWFSTEKVHRVIKFN